MEVEEESDIYEKTESSHPLTKPRLTS